MQAQSTSLSPRAALTLSDILLGKCATEKVQAIVMVPAGTDRKAFDAYDVEVNTVTGKMMTVRIPIKQFEQLVASGLCTYIDVAQQVHPYLDRTRNNLGIDYIHQGLNLPQGYDGSGVVVGVIDRGFEYGHPSFYDSTGTTLRIKRVWQQGDSSGVPPATFSYGREYSTQADILAAVTDDPAHGHGSHTAGIAAGCGAPDAHGRHYCGMAPAADIVLVGCNMQEAGIIDGIRYIHEYARSVGKPCVINISLGTAIGPHDGLGVFEMMMESYLHSPALDSLAVVVSAGNSGNTANHLHKQFSETDTVVRTFMRDLIYTDYNTTIDCWGDVGDSFSVSLAMYKIITDISNHTFFAELPPVPSTIDSVYTYQLANEDDSVYTCQFSVVHASPFNQRPEILVNISKAGRSAANDIFTLTIKSHSANVHVWSDEEDFFDGGDTDFVTGDTDYLINGVGANTDAVISVGCYATRTGQENGTILDRQSEGEISQFSSHGPTCDGRTKPDIAAPGQVLVSSVNTPYLSEYPSRYLYDSTTFNGQTYYYVLMQGTSMSSPTTAGVVALWMQNNPSLNVDSVRTLLQTTAIHDSFTGDIPETGSNIWGWGKLNAFGGLATTVPMYRLNAFTEDYVKGYVSGQGCHPQGQHTIVATEREGYAFLQWNDGVTDNPRVIDLTSDTTFTAYFDSAPCDTIQQFPWEASLTEGSINCWDNFGITGWITAPTDGMISVGTTGRCNNWLISPYVLVAPHTSLFYACTGTLSDSMAVVAITDDGDTTILADELYTAISSGEDAVDLTPYAGRVVRLGFHHHASGAYGILQLHSARIDYVEGIDGVDLPNFSVVTSGLQVTISGAPEGPMSIYDILGRRVLASPTANSTFRLPATGVYIIRIGELCRKMVVR